MRKTFILSLGACLLVLSGLFLACKKNVPVTTPPPVITPPPATLAISAVTPLAGEVATTVTISGSGFSAVLSADSVFFNGKSAVINNASDGQLLVAVPSLAGTGNITVKVNGVSVTGPSFTYNYQYVVSTFAGSGVPGPHNDYVDSLASLNNPYGIAVVGAGLYETLYVADEANNWIRRISGSGVWTMAGSPVAHWGLLDGNGFGAEFDNPTGIAADNTGNLYVADLFNNVIRLVTPGRDVTTIAGSASGHAGSADGVGGAATFNQPKGIAWFSGNLYVTDYANHTVRLLTPGGTETIAGNPNSQGSADGVGMAANFVNPNGIAVDSSGTIYVSDSYNCNIRMIGPGRVVTTLAGSTAHQLGSADGTGTTARFNSPAGLALDGKGNLYVADQANNSIRKIVIQTGLVSTVAGNAFNRIGSTDGIGRAASFYGPAGIAIDGAGNLFIADTRNNKIREIMLQ